MNSLYYKDANRKVKRTVRTVKKVRVLAPWEADVPPQWRGRESEMKDIILQLTTQQCYPYWEIEIPEKFVFDIEENQNHLTLSQHMIQIDKKLQSTSDFFVPSSCSEKDFWRIYFYLVYLVRIEHDPSFFFEGLQQKLENSEKYKGHVEAEKQLSDTVLTCFDKFNTSLSKMDLYLKHLTNFLLNTPPQFPPNAEGEVPPQSILPESDYSATPPSPIHDLPKHEEIEILVKESVELKKKASLLFSNLSPAYIILREYQLSSRDSMLTAQKKETTVQKTEIPAETSHKEAVPVPAPEEPPKQATVEPKKEETAATTPPKSAPVEILSTTTTADGDDMFDDDDIEEIEEIEVVSLTMKGSPAKHEGEALESSPSKKAAVEETEKKQETAPKDKDLETKPSAAPKPAETLEDEEKAVKTEVQQDGTITITKKEEVNNEEKIEKPTQTQISEPARVKTEKLTIVIARPDEAKTRKNVFKNVHSMNEVFKNMLQRFKEYENMRNQFDQKFQECEENKKKTKAAFPSFIPKLLGSKFKGTKSVTTEIQRKKLVKLLPKRLQARNWSLVYSTREHGTSMGTFLRQNEKKQYPLDTLTLIQTKSGVIFGGFNAEPWKNSQNRFFGTGETFVFSFMRPGNEKLTPEEQTKESKCIVFKWSQKNKFFIRVSSSQLVFGGGDDGKAAIILDSSFEFGSTHPCQTFDSECLNFDSEEFGIRHVECWALEEAKSKSAFACQEEDEETKEEEDYVSFNLME